MVALAAIAQLGTATTISAQDPCPSWSAQFHIDGAGEQLYSVTSYDDGSGPALIAASFFGVLRWSGSEWTLLGATNGVVVDLLAYDDGGGIALYACGTFTTIGGITADHVARWDGTRWTPLGFGLAGPAYGLVAHDDGSGPELYCGGFSSTFTSGYLARWNGTAWSSLGGSIGAGGIAALASHDDGSGPALFVAGDFTSAGGVAVNRIAKWDGSSWSPLGSGMPSGYVDDLVVHDNGTGHALYACGDFETAGGVTVNRVAKWEGGAWSALGTGIGGSVVLGLASVDLGAGPGLYACGQFTTAGGATARNAAAWNGTSWTPLGTGLQEDGFNAYARQLAAHDGGTGPRLYVVGRFETAGTALANGIAGWDGAAWSSLGSGAGTNESVGVLHAHDDGSGEALYAGGGFTRAGNVNANRIARWDGAAWSTVGTGFNSSVKCLATHDDGTGSALYAGGSFTSAGGASALRVARWDGATWSAVGSGFPGVGGTVGSLASHGAGGPSLLYAGGGFTVAQGAVADRIAAWDGQTWSPLGTGMNNSVSAMASFDEGAGPVLFAGGVFTLAGGLPASYLARWDGSAWTPVGPGTNAYVSALVVYDDGNGPALYVGGNFTQAGGMSASRIARWDGASWSQLGSGVNSTVDSLTVFNNGTGPALYVGGAFTHAGGAPAKGIARWDGSSWSAVDTGIQNSSGGIGVFALAGFARGTEPESLYVGGHFSNAGGLPSSHVARWTPCPSEPTALCLGDGSAAVCPCGNVGAPGRGCDNSAGTGGALLSASGTISPDTLVLAQQGELASSLSIFLQGSVQLPSPVVFGDGLRCTGGALKRLYVKTASAGSVSAPQGGDPSITTQSAALGDPLAPGSTRFYQVYYRDPDLSFCPAPPGDGFNVGNALRVVW